MTAYPPDPSGPGTGQPQPAAQPHPAGPGGGQADPVPRCYRHPNREALLRCVRCDRPICPQCTRPAAIGYQCPDDAGADRRGNRPLRNTVGARVGGARPWVTWVLLAANVAVYAVTAVTGHGANSPGASRLFQDWELQPAAVVAQGSYYRLLTAAFLHAGLLHIAVNMLSLLFIGPTVERFLGRWRYAVLYLLGALGGSATVFAFGAPGTAVVGASAALFALLGTCLVLARRIGLDVQYLIAIVLLNFVLTFSVAGISKLGHIGGFATGLLAAVALAGLPGRNRRLSPPTQAAGLATLFVLIVVIVAARAASF